MFRVTHIRTKLAVIVAVPLLGVVGVAFAASSGVVASSAPLQVFGGVVLASIVITLVLVLLGSRWITRPLTSLLDHAEEVAESWLPNAVRQILETPPGAELVVPEVPRVPVAGRDEMAAVAEALRSVQARSLALAAEQVRLRRSAGESFLNLGRRNQNLLTRQIDFITELERNESDPDTLEGLFRLDHLATRMRRHAESLLLLAGVESPRQWSAPVKLGDVVRAALGEVEDYQRVVIRHLEPAEILGPVAADIAHLAAELIENALSFSPPDQQVEIKGRLTVSGYTLAITDNGHGMTTAEIEQANRRLAAPEEFTVAPSRYLGHLVAAHLARRLGAVVSLHESPAGGLTARVEVPMALLANEEVDARLQVSAPPSAAAASIAAVPARPIVTSPDQPAQGRPVPAEPAAARVSTEPVTAAPVTAEPVPEAAEPVAPVSAEPVPKAAQAAEPLREIETPVSANAPVERPPAHLAAPRAESQERGFGGLAVTRPLGPSLHTLVAKQARASATGAESTTPAGLPRRVPGAQRPAPAMSDARGSEPVAPGETAPRSTPEDVYSFLSSFQSGVQRGREEGHVEPDGAADPKMRDDR